MSAIAVRSLTKRYGATVAARDVSFEVAQGEIFGLIGPNGAGKTTVLECILGLIRPDVGEILVRGIDVRTQPALAKEKLGAQLQTSALPDAMTPRQALKLCGAFYRSAAAPAALFQQFDLHDKADVRYSALSTGQKQRLALALAFVSQPEVVVLDEPTASLDPAARRELHALIAAQRTAGRTIIFTTHYLEEARLLCDRVALMAGGRLVAVDTPAALIAQSGVLPRIGLRTAARLAETTVSTLPGVVGLAAHGEVWVIETTALTSTLAAVAMAAEAARTEVEDIQIYRPTLDDAFAKLLEGRA